MHILCFLIRSDLESIPLGLNLFHAPRSRLHSLDADIFGRSGSSTPTFWTRSSPTPTTWSNAVDLLGAMALYLDSCKLLGPVSPCASSDISRSPSGQHGLRSRLAVWISLCAERCSFNLPLKSGEFKAPFRQPLLLLSSCMSWISASPAFRTGSCR